jgi:hypothetical protein
VRDAPAFHARLFRFLDVRDDHVVADRSRENVGGVHRSRAIAFLLNRPNPLRFVARKLLPARWRIGGRRRLRGLSLAPPPPLPPGLRAELTRRLAGEIDALEELLGRDLDAWRAPSPREP